MKNNDNQKLGIKFAGLSLAVGRGVKRTLKLIERHEEITIITILLETTGYTEDPTLVTPTNINSTITYRGYLVLLLPS